MKKRILIIIFIISITVIITSIYSNNKKVYLNEKLYSLKSESFIKINNEELKLLENNNESFLVFVHQPLCAASDILYNIVKYFSNTHQINFYKIAYSETKDTKLDRYVKFYPSVVIYRRGKIIAYLDTNKQSDIPYFTNYEDFKDWLSEYIIINHK